MAAGSRAGMGSNRGKGQDEGGRGDGEVKTSLTFAAAEGGMEERLAGWRRRWVFLKRRERLVSGLKGRHLLFFSFFSKGEILREENNYNNDEIQPP